MVLTAMSALTLKTVVMITTAVFSPRFFFIFSHSENDSITEHKNESGSDGFPGHVIVDDLHKPGAVKASLYPGRVARSSTPKPAEQRTCSRAHSSDCRVSLTSCLFFL